MGAKPSKKKAAAKKKPAAKRLRTKSDEESFPPLAIPLDQFLAGLMNLGLDAEELEDNPVEQAQMLVYDAWEAPTRAKGVALARKALNISADCADAYSFLANATAKTRAEAIALYKEAVAAAERVLGPEIFEECVGHFWGLLETRPYMRARANLAETRRQMGQITEAVAHYQDLLRLNPGDNQGLRYYLLNCFFELDMDSEAENLIARYKDDDMAFWNYSRALLAYRQHGATSPAAKALKRALCQNPNVPDFLLGKKRLPATLPGSYSSGSESEAILYVKDSMRAWALAPGALYWLSRQSRG